MRKPLRARPADRINVLLDRELRERLRRHALRVDVAMSRIIEQALVEYLDAEDRERLAGRPLAVLGQAWKATV